MESFMEYWIHSNVQNSELRCIVYYKKPYYTYYLTKSVQRNQEKGNFYRNPKK